MHVQKTQSTDTTINLSISADDTALQSIKQQVLQDLKKDVKLPGFRAGKVPAELIERNVDQSTLQNQFLDQALNYFYNQALQEERIRPASQPKVSIKKFVPFTTLEFDAELEIVGDVTLPDYKRITVTKKPVKVTDTDVNEVVENLRLRMAEKWPVDRAAQAHDEVIIDFAGSDAKTNQPINGGDGQNYPLVLGSNSFIPGFEDNLIGIKAGEDRDFTIDFPKDYGVTALQNRKVVFKVSAKEVQEITLPKPDDAFAAQAGPFKTVTELKADIKKQITSERTTQNERDFESDLLSAISDKTKVAVPASLVDEEVERIEQEERQNVTYRGQTWEEHLADENVNAEGHKAKNRPGAELRVKAGLILAEVAELEKIQVTPEEFEIRMQLLKGQYQDAAMQSELDKPQNRRELASRLLTEKTIAKLAEYAQAAAKPTSAK